MDLGSEVEVDDLEWGLDLDPKAEVGSAASHKEDNSNLIVPIVAFMAATCGVRGKNHPSMNIWFQRRHFKMPSLTFNFT